MARPQKTEKAPKSIASTQSLSSFVKSICDVMRRSNCASALQYVPELTWILFLRILDAQEALELKLVTELHEPDALLDAADALADRIAQQDPLAVRLSKRVFHLPREAHPHVDEIAQAILFESEAKFERMQAFLDRKKK